MVADMRIRTPGNARLDFPSGLDKYIIFQPEKNKILRMTGIFATEPLRTRGDDFYLVPGLYSGTSSVKKTG